MKDSVLVRLDQVYTGPHAPPIVFLTICVVCNKVNDCAQHTVGCTCKPGDPELSEDQKLHNLTISHQGLFRRHAGHVCIYQPTNQSK